MNRRTLGYIVCGGDDSPLRWYPSESRFYRGVFGPHSTASVFLATDYSYEDVRRAIALHYKTIRSQEQRVQHKSAWDLRIIRLADALRFK
ncbi:MAG TPA: hypothetical protein VGO43_08255 [Pyrinomonadaceae bacterium]|jgi:hypothetical protein|nr:hypothetical protein [Pyrinomonadaceae bacterium]